VTAIQVILMTVLGLGSLAVVTLLLGSGVCLAVVLVRESKKLDGAVALSERIAALAADTAVARKELNALDEIVATKLNRMATEKKRSVKKQLEDEEDEPKYPRDLEFPSMVKNA